MIRNIRITRQIAIYIITTLLVLTTLSGPMSTIMAEEPTQTQNPFTTNDHVTPSIWSYANVLNRPAKAMVLTFNHHPWEALTAVSMVPVFIGRTGAVPIIFDDGTEDVEWEIEHDTQSVSALGSEAISASAVVAKQFWSKAELVFVVDSYEQALWVVPSAAFLSAPILVSPTKETLNSLGTKCAISVGSSPVLAEKVIALSTKESVWSFQLELYGTKGVKCNYVILTNPHDTTDNLNPNIKWPYLSLATAPLATFRNALVQTGDYTGDKEKLEQVAKAQGRLDSVYQEVRPYFEKVKSDSYLVEKFLIDNNHVPEFIALVGGAFAVPDYYFDIHTEYKYWDQILDYVPSISPYANLTNEYPTNITVKEDLGAGRIVGHNIYDASLMLMRTFFYSEFLQGGEYSGLLSAGWEKNTAVLDGHRLNQPRDGGPPDETSTKPYYPGGDILELQEAEKYNSNYYLPQNESDPYDTNPPVSTILDNLESTSLVQVLAHGGSMRDPRKIWLEGGYLEPGGEEKRIFVTSSDIMARSLPPSLYYFIACHTAHIFIDIEMAEYFPLAFIHSGAVSFIGPVTCQAICFWYKAPYGPASTQALYFWQNLITKDMPIGPALAKAKWSAYQEWVKEYPNDQRIEPDSPAFHLFGDPAHRFYIPNVKSEKPKEMDPEILISEATPGKDFIVQVTVKDLAMGNMIDTASVKVNFMGVEKSGSRTQFTAPAEPGEYTLTVTVSSSGYTRLSGATWVQVGEGDGEDDGHGKLEGNKLMLWGGLIVIIIIVLILIGVVMKVKKKKS
ncbi:hypothetical protein [[Eubacterium] cellulosolvens]